MSRTRILALEPYYGGSHRSVLEGLVSCLDAEWALLTLPARKWKWRMRGAAITMAAEARVLAQRGAADGAPFDVIFASTFLNLAEFRGMAGERFASVPAIVYFHENQLAYPVRHTAEWDYQFPLTNITSALAAECCIFNSHYNLGGFLGGIEGFIGEFPDHRPKGLAEAITEKSRVIAPPFDPGAFDAAPPLRGERCRIVWPHRWEHDKDPAAFFSAVEALAAEGLDFEVAVAGQSFRETAPQMREAAAVLGDRLVHCDEPETRADYAALLASADVAVSTASNEFFGIAMMEACYAGAAPLVPDRLAYRELYPEHARYGSADGLVARLRAHIIDRPAPNSARELAARYTFDELVPAYDAAFAEVVRRGR